MKKSKNAINPVSVPKPEINNELNFDEVDLDLDDFNDFSFEDVSSTEVETLVSFAELDEDKDVSSFDFESEVYNGKIFKGADCGAAKHYYQDCDEVLIHMQDVRVDIRELISSIKGYKASRVKHVLGTLCHEDDKNFSSNDSDFFLPKFVVDVLNEYGYQDEIKGLCIKAPNYFIDNRSCVFEKRIALIKEVYDFEYSCTFRISLHNLFSLANPHNVFYKSGLNFVQYLHNLCQGQGDWGKFRSLGDIRLSEFSIIPSKRYNEINKTLFSELSIYGARKRAGFNI